MTDQPTYILPDAFFTLPLPDVNAINTHKHGEGRNLAAVVDFGDVSLQIRSTALARELIDAGLDALEILDPDGPLKKIRELIADLGLDADESVPEMIP